jgi:2,3-diketo-5-methylthio-1-phosphopentane phosphatase
LLREGLSSAVNNREFDLGAMKIFVDFDGTITKHDVGNAFFKHFGGEKCTERIAEYRAGNISAKELFRRETAALGQLDLHEARAFLQRQPIDESFKRFVGFCRERGVEFHVVSDGIDFYIEEIFAHNGIEGVSFFANRFHFGAVERDDASQNGFATPRISFPYDDAECTRCACCKRNIMLVKSSDEDSIVYVGEGYSDRCPAQYADIVFAKDDLQAFCQEKNISYFLYDSFDDVVARLNELLSKKRLKKRREAEIKRREAFVAE